VAKGRKGNGRKAGWGKRPFTQVKRTIPKEIKPPRKKEKKQEGERGVTPLIGHMKGRIENATASYGQKKKKRNFLKKKRNTKTKEGPTDELKGAGALGLTKEQGTSGD